ncbi:DUF3000 domain-containing protein [Corynebacterium aquilae]|uniref:Membrane protein n=1 Tax=Corynebacterium aquilae DSM 44791 TaxID=1431546 RepID=A0A1L7CGB5_9CORY|nr:DUF3000 domain-containing protein [Corynebacterium aquilae]APT84887.1 membrane protein [Corynebacterium aquilae DSM 44791]
MTKSDATSGPATAAAATTKDATPQLFKEAVESMYISDLRSDMSLGTIRPPQKLATHSHAIGLEVTREIPEDNIPTDASGDAFGRLIVLYEPAGEEAWDGDMRLVAYIQADMDDAVAGDPLLPDVAWDWLQEGLGTTGADFTNLGGTVTSTASVRFGDIGGPPRAFQLELRASWTANGNDLAAHVRAFADVLAHVAGLPPEGVTSLHG